MHRKWLSGIDYRPAKDGEEAVATAVVSSGGYEDDEDDGDELWYTGSGGNDLLSSRRQTGAQKLEKGRRRARAKGAISQLVLLDPRSECAHRQPRAQEQPREWHAGPAAAVRGRGSLPPTHPHTPLAHAHRALHFQRRASSGLAFGRGVGRVAWPSPQPCVRGEVPLTSPHQVPPERSYSQRLFIYDGLYAVTECAHRPALWTASLHA